MGGWVVSLIGWQDGWQVGKCQNAGENASPSLYFHISVFMHYIALTYWCLPSAQEARYITAIPQHLSYAPSSYRLSCQTDAHLFIPKL